MEQALFDGILLGLTLAVFGGPVFFALIQISVEYGFVSAMFFAAGVFISDLLCILLAYLGASQLLDSEQNKMIIGVAGGCILVVFGMLNIFKKKQGEGKDLHLGKVNKPLLAVKGFLINTFNPFVIIFWLGVVSLGTTKYQFTPVKTFTFLCGILGTVLITDIIKSYIAIKIRKILNPETLLLVNRIAGVIIVLFGLSLVYRVLF